MDFFGGFGSNRYACTKDLLIKLSATEQIYDASIVSPDQSDCRSKRLIIGGGSA